MGLAARLLVKRDDPERWTYRHMRLHSNDVGSDPAPWRHLARKIVGESWEGL